GHPAAGRPLHAANTSDRRLSPAHRVVRIELAKTASAGLAPEQRDENGGADRGHGDGQNGGRKRRYARDHTHTLGRESAELAARGDPPGGAAAAAKRIALGRVR